MIPMTSLSRAPNGDWFARKGIPADVRAEYKLAHGVSQEERFRRPAVLPVGRAKEALREWDMLVTGRIEALRARRRGEGVSLSLKEADGLAARWYGWFVERHEATAEHSHPEAWETAIDTLRELTEREEHNPDDVTEGLIRSHVLHAGEVPAFLGAAGMNLSAVGLAVLLDRMRGDLVAAYNSLSRRADGNFAPDPRAPDEHRKSLFKKATGLTCHTLFARWIAERKPAASTVTRWRSAVLDLEAHFGDRDISTVSPADAVQWKDRLLTEERSAATVNDSWLRAAKVIFGHAVANKLITRNPFDGVRVAAAGKKPSLRPKAFYPEETATILPATLAPAGAGLAAHNAAARRWVPWLCAYSGARVGEMTQLRGQDVRQVAGVWVMRITPEAGTQKTQDARDVPLHEHLIDQGFLDFARKAGPGPLFYREGAQRVQRNDPTHPDQPPYVKSRVKLSEWVRSIGVTDKGISPNHAWRHTFKTRALRPDLGIPETVIDHITGHAPRTEGQGYYSKEVSNLAGAMARFPRYDVSPAPNEVSETAGPNSSAERDLQPSSEACLPATVPEGRQRSAPPPSPRSAQ